MNVVHVGGGVPSPTKFCSMEKSRNKDSTNPLSTTLFHLLNISPQKQTGLLGEIAKSRSGVGITQGKLLYRVT